MLSSSRAVNSSTADNFGIWASSLCAVHCAVSPLLFLITPAIAAWWVASSVHIAAALLVIPLAIFALYRGWKKHTRVWPLVCAGFAALLILAGLSPLTAEWMPLQLTWGLMADGIGQESVAVVCCPTLQMSSAGGSLLIPWVTLLTMFGSLLLIIAHAVNITLLKRAAQKACCDCACN